MDWTCILEALITGKLRLWVFDKGHDDELGRYVIAKTFKASDGNFRRTQTYRHQRPAAIRYAQRWIEERAALPSQPIPAQKEAA